MEIGQHYQVVRTGRAGGLLPKSWEITIHTHTDGKPSGAVIFRCPVCNALQNKFVEIQGTDAVPTIPTIMKCDCVRCAQYFRIATGKAHLVDSDEPAKRKDLNEQMVNAGVFYQSQQKRGWTK